MKNLNEEEQNLNLRGSLSEVQFKHLQKYGWSQLIVAGIFVALLVVSMLMTQMKWSWLTLIWIGGGLLFTGIYVYTALTYLRIKRIGNLIQTVSGITVIKDSGKRHRLLKIGDQSFFVLKNQSAGIENNKEYTVFYLDNPRVVLGWIELAKPLP